MARQRIRDFVRMSNKQHLSSPRLPSAFFSLKSPNEKHPVDDDARLAIYTQLLEDTKYALPFIPILSEDDKKERLRNSYRACMISNEILKQLNNEAEVFTNITSMRHKQTGHWMYFNRATGQEVDADEYMDRYSDYINESKVYYDPDGGLDESYFEQGIDLLGVDSDIDGEDVDDVCVLEEEEEEDEVEVESEDVDISSSSASSGSSMDSAHLGDSDSVVSTSPGGCLESPSTLGSNMIIAASAPTSTGLQCRTQFPHRKRCSSTASNTDECNSLEDIQKNRDGDDVDRGSPGRSIREDRKRSKSLDSNTILAQSLIQGSIWESESSLS